MALTMSRTRTQTALTKMATLLAKLNGELEFVRALLAAKPARRDALATRETDLQQKREAVMAAIRQFDPSIDPDAVGATEGWKRCYTRKPSHLRDPERRPGGSTRAQG